MAQTKRKRQRKRRGTQGGRVDASGRAARPRTREEAKARARSRGNRSAPKADLPPTWRGAIVRGLVMAAVFVLLLALFGNGVGAALVLGLFMLAIYVPGNYYIEMALWRRRERARMRGRQD